MIAVDLNELELLEESALQSVATVNGGLFCGLVCGGVICGFVCGFL